MTTISKERVKDILEFGAGRIISPITDDEIMELARIALASLEAEAVARPKCKGTGMADSGSVQPWGEPINVPCDCTAQPAPVSVPDLTALDKLAGEMLTHAMNCERRVAVAYTHCSHRLAEEVRDLRTAMLQGAKPVTTACKLPDDFDFDRFNDVVWLEAVASNPHMHSPTTSTIAMVALELNSKLADGNSPVIPDGWVACSWRMPKKNERVLIFINFNCDSVPPSIHDAQFTGSTFRRGGATVNVFPLEDGYGVTHWMPLPAAPQQEA